MTELVLGPLFRYAGTESASFWVETSAACEVECSATGLARSRRRPSFRAACSSTTSSPRRSRPTTFDSTASRLAARRWTATTGRSVRERTSGSRASCSARAGLVIRSRPGSRRRRPRRPRQHRDRCALDVSRSSSSAARSSGRTRCCCSATRSTQTSLAGDARRSSGAGATPAQPPGEQIADFEEYTHLYRESWSDPDIRWLLSTVPTTMIFDDHDVHDDWNISWLWVQEMRARPWWERADNRRLHGLLDLPAPRQPLAAGARRGRAARTRQSDEDAGPRLRRPRRCGIGVGG